MDEVKKYIEDETRWVSTAITTEDKIKHLISNYESPLVDIDKLAKLLALMVAPKDGVKE